MKYVFIILLFLISCTKQYTVYEEEETDPKLVTTLPGRCTRIATLHWTKIPGAKEYKVFMGCSMCTMEQHLNGTCDVGLNYYATTKETHFEKKTSNKECRDYAFGIKSVADGFESDMSNVVKCTTDKIKPNSSGGNVTITALQEKEATWEPLPVLMDYVEHPHTVYWTDEVNHTFAWDCQPDPVDYYEFQAVKIEDPAHPTVFPLGTTTECQIIVNLPAYPGHYIVRVRSCIGGSCSDWAESNGPDSALCHEPGCPEFEPGAWEIYMKLAPPVIIIE